MRADSHADTELALPARCAREQDQADIRSRDEREQDARADEQLELPLRVAMHGSIEDEPVEHFVARAGPPGKIRQNLQKTAVELVDDGLETDVRLAAPYAAQRDPAYRRKYCFRIRSPDQHRRGPLERNPEIGLELRLGRQGAREVLGHDADDLEIGRCGDWPFPVASACSTGSLRGGGIPLVIDLESLPQHVALAVEL